MNKLNDCIGKTISAVSGLERGEETVVIQFTDGSSVQMYHQQDCCEYVRVEDVTGDPADLIGGVVVTFEERGSDANDVVSESGTWTFYEIRTTRGDVTIRWLGESNGYYSESVYLNFHPSIPYED